MRNPAGELTRFRSREAFARVLESNVNMERNPGQPESRPDRLCAPGSPRRDESLRRNPAASGRPACTCRRSQSCWGEGPAPTRERPSSGRSRDSLAAAGHPRFPMVCPPLRSLQGVARFSRRWGWRGSAAYPKQLRSSCGVMLLGDRGIGAFRGGIRQQVGGLDLGGITR